MSVSKELIEILKFLNAILTELNQLQQNLGRQTKELSKLKQLQVQETEHLISKVNLWKATLDRLIGDCSKENFLKEITNFNKLQYACLKRFPAQLTNADQCFNTVNAYYFTLCETKFDKNLRFELQDALIKDFAEHQYKFGLLYQKNNSEKPAASYQKVFDYLIRAAELGHCEARFELGRLYQLGLGEIAADNIKAFKYYELSAEQGHLLAQLKLGLMYEQGLGCQQDYREAYRWYSKAANNGSLSASNQLKLFRTRTLVKLSDQVNAIHYFSWNKQRMTAFKNLQKDFSELTKNDTQQDEYFSKIVRLKNFRDAIDKDHRENGLFNKYFNCLPHFFKTQSRRVRKIDAILKEHHVPELNIRPTIKA